MFSLLYKYSLFYIFCKGIEPPLRFFEIKDECLITHTFVLKDKLLKVLPKLPDGCTLFGKFGDGMVGEVLLKQLLFVSVVRIEPESADRWHHQCVDLAAIGKGEKVFYFGNIFMGIKAFWKIEVLIIVCNKVALPGIGSVTLQCNGTPEVCIVLLYRYNMHTGIFGTLCGSVTLNKKFPQKGFSLLLCRREFAFAAAAFALFIAKQIGIGVVTVETMHVKVYILVPKIE